jgi:uncharacterized protein involved in exopolysaccharide biosynthesis
VQLSDIGRRIFREHSRLIAALVVAGLVAGLLLQVTQGKTYTASARLVLDTADPESPSESKAIADTAKAIATSTAQVRAALAAAHLQERNAVEVARDRVSIQALGTSGVLQLSVTDPDRHAAAALTNALAERVIETRLAVSNGQLQQVLARLQERIDGLNSKIAALDAQADASTSSSQRAALLQSRDLLIQQRSVAESERVSLLSTDATRPKAGIISRATIPTQADASHWLSDALLGAVLGLILGIGAAAAIETVRPTIAGSENLAETLGIPLIGVLQSVYPGERRPAVEDLKPLRARLQLAGDEAGARKIGLIATDASIDLTDLATQLATPRSAPDSVEVSPVNLDESELEGRRETAVVLVSPTSLKRAELLTLDRRLTLMTATLLGLITYQGPHARQWPWSDAQDRVAIVSSD